MTYKPLPIGKRRNVLRTILSSILCVLVLCAIFTTAYQVNRRQSKNIVWNESCALNLSAWDFRSRGMNFLETGWQFYPNRLLSPQDFATNSPTNDKERPAYDASLIPHYSNVKISVNGWTDLGTSSIWRSKSEEPGPMDTFGFGTYRLVVKVSDVNHMIAVDFPEINQAAQIWINGNLVQTIGQVSSSKDSYNAESRPVDITFMPSSAGIVEIVVVCANFTGPFGGITCSPAIGTVSQIDNLTIVSKMWIAGVFTLLILIVITGFYLSFTFESKDKYFLFILLIALSLAYEFCDKSFNPMPDIWNRLLQTTFYLLMALVAMLYFSALLPKNEHFFFNRLNNWDVHIAFSFCLLFLIVFWLHPEFLYNRTSILLYVAFVVLISLYNVIRMFLLSFTENPNSTFLTIAAITATSVFITLPIRSQQIYFVPLHSIGIVLMIFGTAMYFTISYVRAYNKVSRFTLELEAAVQDKTRNIAKVNAELLQANQKLMENEEARKKMMSNVSHDLRTPIAAIRGYLELLMKGGRSITPETSDTYVRNMHTRCMQMEQLIEDLMQLTRLESGSVNLNYQVFSVREILESLFDLYSAESEHTGKEFVMDLPEDDELNVLGDSNGLIRVFDNLIVNSMRYTKENGHIALQAFRDTSENTPGIHVIIKDDGCGIPADEIAYVFDRFYRAANSSINKTGSGLGLAIVKSIVLKHHGKVWVESQINIGSSFHVLLPPSEK